MAEKKINIGATDILLCVISVFFVAGIFVIFNPCGPKSDGSWMLCHWAGNAVKGTSFVLLAISLAHILLGNSFVKIGLDIAAIPLSIFAALIPANVIPLCMMKEMRCHTVMHPAVIVVSILLIVSVSLDILSQLKKART